MAMPKTPALTTDCVLFDAGGRVLLIRRGHDPFKGAYALPGGFVDIGETVEEACRRELREEAGIEVGDLTLVGVYSDPRRDPRGHTSTVAFMASAPAVPHLSRKTMRLRSNGWPIGAGFRSPSITHRF